MPPPPQRRNAGHVDPQPELVRRADAMTAAWRGLGRVDDVSQMSLPWPTGREEAIR